MNGAHLVESYVLWVVDFCWEKHPTPVGAHYYPLVFVECMVGQVDLFDDVVS